MSDSGGVEHTTDPDAPTMVHIVPVGGPVYEASPGPSHTTSLSKGAPGSVEAGAMRQVVTVFTLNGKVGGAEATLTSEVVPVITDPAGGVRGAVDVGGGTEGAAHAAKPITNTDKVTMTNRHRVSVHWWPTT